MLKNYKDMSFGTSQDNVQGLRLNLKFDEDTKTAYGEIELGPQYQGHAENEAHPGVLAVMLDEVMVHINKAMNIDAGTGELTIRYLQPANTSEPLYLRGYFVRKNKRIIENRAEIEDDIGKIIARAKGKYIEIDPLDDN